MPSIDNDDDDSEIAREERAIYLVLAIVGTPIAMAALATGDAFDTGPTLSLVCIALAVVGLLHLARRPMRIPRAELRAATRGRRADRAAGNRHPPR
jgi:energy-converting hydrogenase Eha subunit H